MIKIDDFLKYKTLSNVNYSPDGRFAAFVAIKPLLSENCYNETLCLLDLESRKQREVFSVNGAVVYKWVKSGLLLVLSRRGQAETEFSFINAETGHKSHAFIIPKIVNDIYALAGGTYVFTSVTDHNTSPLPPELSYLSKDVKHEIIDELPFWFNGKGFINKKRTGLFTYNPATGEITGITLPMQNVSSIRAIEGKLYFTAETFTDIKPVSGLYCYDKAIGNIECLVPEDTYRIHGYGVLKGCPFIIGADKNKKLVTDNPAFYFVKKDGNLEPFLDINISPTNNIATDMKQGIGETLRTFNDELFFVMTDEFSSNIWKTDAEGNVTVVTSERGCVDAFDVCERGIVFSGMRGHLLHEIYSVTEAGQNRLTDINTETLTANDISVPQTVTFKNGGFNVNYVVLKPYDFQPDKTYPAVLYIHGGAKVCYSEVFFHEMQCLASKGYFVFYGNPRGSDGQGSEFARLCGHYGEIDYADIMAAVDYVLLQFPQIDPNRLGVMGGSYGGIMTNFIVGKTNRFKCAVAQRSICNMTTAITVADNGYGFVMEQMDSSPWDNYEKLWNQSPLKYASNVKTPMLFIHSTEDYRCHYAEAMQMFAAVKLHGNDARICLIDGENHELSRNGRPKQRLLRLAEIFGWADKYL